MLVFMQYLLCVCFLLGYVGALVRRSSQYIALSPVLPVFVRGTQCMCIVQFPYIIVWGHAVSKPRWLAVCRWLVAWECHL